jgi:hypothetical protein
MLKNNFFKNRTAFTLAEMLLVAAMIGVITLSLYQALTNGIKIWERSRAGAVEEDVMIFFDRLTTDLRNAFNFSLFEFKPESNKIIFSTLVSVPMSRPGSDDVVFYTDQIGRVEYGFDSADQTIYRRQANYGQAVKSEFGEKRILVSRVSRMIWKYFERGPLGLSEKKLDQRRLPAVIEVSVEYVDGQGHPQKMTRMINLPLSL